ncbi:hypothetical protein LCL86_14210 [Muricauda ruestringensis]|uniref:hypothetical protein n=1 Tax=Flagellimonas ruestringensis TaxID=111501 RepID=UPI001CD4E1CB|nr:hypothetical protein [Allomuricauda ruestringensis]MCA0960208.1 hypothetical protein [Allomuricauda ruestringensis]
MTEPQKIMKLYNDLVQSTIHEFPSFGKINVSTRQGVYIVYDNSFNPLHVGKTNGARNGLNQRLLNHVRNQSSFSKLYMQKNKVALRAWGKFQYIELEDDRERALLEALTAGLLCPKHIGTGTGK